MAAKSDRKFVEKETKSVFKGKSSRYREFADIPCGNIPEDSIKVA